MAASITPGYDFTVDEVPTKTKIEIAARGMQISALDFNDVDATIRLALNGQESGGSGASMADEGWLYFDARGNMWVKQRWTARDFGMTGQTESFSDTMLFRSAGGYASSRIPMTDGTNRNAGRPVQIYGLGSGADNYSPANIGARAQWVITHVEGGMDPFFLEETAVSGSRINMVGRGVTKQFLATGQAHYSIVRRVLSPAGTAWLTYQMNSSPGYKRAIGTFYGWHPDAGGTTTRTDWMLFWAYGKPVYGASSGT